MGYEGQLMTLPTMTEALERIGLDARIGTKVRCPEHEDKTPSLHLYEDGWYCFSCARHGDGIGLIALFQGVPVSRLLRGRKDAYSRSPLRRTSATQGVKRGGLRNAVLFDLAELSRRTFDELAWIYQGAPLWQYLRAIEVWSMILDQARDEIEGVGMWLEDEPLPVASAERRLKALRKEVERGLEHDRQDAIRAH